MIFCLCEINLRLIVVLGILHFKEKKGKLGSMPASGGDILVHVKAKNISQCYEVIHQFVNALPAGSVASIDDEYVKLDDKTFLFLPFLIHFYKVRLAVSRWTRSIWIYRWY